MIEVKENPMTTIAIDTRHHALDPLNADEITAVRDHLVAEGRLKDRVRVAYLGLKEPAKNLLRDGVTRPARQARVILIDTATGETTDVVVNLTTRETESAVTVDPMVAGQAPVLLEEFDAIEEILAADQGWRAALATRGLTPAAVRVAPLSAGNFDYEGEEGRR